MSKQEFIFAFLAERPDLSIDQALVAALPTADPHAQRLIVEQLLRRNQPSACAEVVRHFHRLDPGVQDLVITRAQDLHGQLRRLSNQTQTQGPENVLTIIRRSGDAKMAYLVVDLLCHGTEPIRHQAAETLHSMAQRADSSDQQSAMNPLNRLYLEEAVHQALSTFSHHRQNLVLATALTALARLAPSLHQLLSDSRQPASVALNRLIQQGENPSIFRVLIPLLGDPPLTDAAVAALARLARTCNFTGKTDPAASQTQTEGLAGIENFQQVLEQSHLLLVGSIRRALGGASDPERLLPRIKVLVNWPAPACRALPAWIVGLNLEPARKVELLSHFRDHADSATRLAALRRLMELSSDSQATGVYSAISGFCADQDLVVARIALRRLLSSSWEGLPRLLSSLTQSPHEELRRLGGQRLAPHAFERLCQAWPHLKPEQRLAAGRALIKINPNFPVHLSERLSSVRRRSRMVALSMIQILGQGPLFEQALRVLTLDVDPTIASAAVRALGTAGSSATVRLLMQLLEHPDARIRANAIESLHQLQQTHRMAALLPGLARDRHSRPRANAIRAWMTMDPIAALEELGQMLIDPDPRHRVSALWLVEELAILDMAYRVSELAIFDPSVPVRHRAQKVVKRLLEASSWAQEHLRHLADAQSTTTTSSDLSGVVKHPNPAGGRV